MPTKNAAKQAAHAQEAQEIFDRVVTHLGKQGRPAKDHEGCCRYRADNGTMCAVGALLTDEEYSPRMEHNNWNGLANLHKNLQPKRLRPHGSLMVLLQNAHDNARENANGTFDRRASDATVVWRLAHIAIDHQFDTTTLVKTFPAAKSLLKPKAA